jgi:hypothetical protein
MIRTLFRSIALAAALAAAPAAAYAQATPPEPTKEHLASARAAIEASRVAEGFDNVLLNVAQQTKALLQRNNPSLTGKIDEVTNKVALELAAKRVDLDKDIQTIWAREFTKPELDEISRFYSSPTGKKLADSTQKVVGLSMEKVIGWQQKISQEMLTRVREEMKKLGHNI